MKFLEVLKNAALTTFLSATMLAGSAQAWTITTIGTINSGTDFAGIYGAAGGNLTGLKYSESITLDPSLYSLQSEIYHQHTGSGAFFGIASSTVSINNISQSFTWDSSNPLNEGQSNLANLHSIGSFDMAYQYHAGYDSKGGYAYIYEWVLSYTHALNLTLDYNQDWSYVVQTGDSGQTYASILDAFGVPSFVFSGTPDLIAIHTDNTGVPEPSTLALLGIGLMGISTGRRKLKC